MDLFWATAYERFYYDEDLIRKQLEACGVDSPAWSQRPSNIPSAEV